MLANIRDIARNTFAESVRQPIYLVLVLVGIGMLALLPFISAFAFRDDNKLLIQLGVSWISVILTLLAAFTATGVLVREIEDKTVLTIISKPVGRPAFILGKFLGVFAAVLVAWTILSLFFLMSIRHGVPINASFRSDWVVILFGGLTIIAALGIGGGRNYLSQSAFAPPVVWTLLIGGILTVLIMLVVNRNWGFQVPTTEWVDEEGAFRGGLVPEALLMVILAMQFLSAIAIAASTRLGQVMTLVVCTGVLIFGQLSNRLLLPQADTNWLNGMLYAVTPNLRLFTSEEAITLGNHFPLAYLGMLAGYAMLLTIAALGLSVLLFQDRQVS